MRYKIKILKDTPWDKAGTELSIGAFRLKYGYICTRDVSDEDLIHYMKDFKSHPILSQTQGVCVSEWFELIEECTFNVGDFVWHEVMKEALAIMPHSSDPKKFRPNYCTLDAVKENPDSYKRLATPEEVKEWNLHSFADGTVLIGRKKSYVLIHVWVEIEIPYNVINDYMVLVNSDCMLDVKVVKDKTTYPINFNGLKIGCKEFSHGEVARAARILGIGCE